MPSSGIQKRLLVYEVLYVSEQALDNIPASSAFSVLSQPQTFPQKQALPSNWIAKLYVKYNPQHPVLIMHTLFKQRKTLLRPKTHSKGTAYCHVAHSAYDLLLLPQSR